MDSTFNFQIKLDYVSHVRLRFFDDFKKLKKDPTLLFSYRMTVVFLGAHLFSNYEFSKKAFIIFKKKKIKKFNILRAPYKNKIAQNSYTWSRYPYSVFLFFREVGSLPVVSTNVFDSTNNNNGVTSDLFSFFVLLDFVKFCFSSNISFLKSFKLIYHAKLQLKLQI